MVSHSLIVKNLHAKVGEKEILKGFNLSVKAGEIHAIMGPNGSGKSTFASVLMGHPKFEVTKGSIVFEDRNLADLSPDERAKLGLFLSFQYPFEVQGLGMGKFLYAAYKARFPEEKMTPLAFQQKLKAILSELHMDASFGTRDLNVGFSGGEKKRAEILQLKLLRPRLAVLDETDSGLDIDSLKLVAQSLDSMRSPDFSAVVITHYKRILNYLKPDFVHVLYDGRIVESGGAELAERLEQQGYRVLLAEKGIAIPDEIKE
ncbi:MAG: Fe-S cluster assembly ATPase SufC [Candidatus Micrarchaeota archaeon]